MITHFSIHLDICNFLDLVRGTETTDEVYDSMIEFGESDLGKGIVHAKDTPNFIGNRIGVYGMMIAINLAQEYGLTVEEVDKLTGPISGPTKKCYLPHSRYCRSGYSKECFAYNL